MYGDVTFCHITLTSCFVVSVPQQKTLLFVMAYSSSDEEYDLFSLFRSHMSSLFSPQAAVAEALIHSSGDPERVERWKLIAPAFRSLR